MRASDTHACWLEVVEPTASAKQVAAWGADSLLRGARFVLDDHVSGLRRDSFAIGRAQRDDVKCGLTGSENSVVRLKRDGPRWRASAGSEDTLLEGRPIGRAGRLIKHGDVVDASAVAVRFCVADADPALGCAWRVDDHIMFPSPFFAPRPRFFRALHVAAHHAPRMVTVAVVDAGTHPDGARGREVHAWRNARLIELDDIDGPTLRMLHERSKQSGGDVDPAFLATICDSVRGVVESLDDVVVRCDGAVVSGSLSTRTIGDSGARLRRMLGVLGRPVAPPGEGASPRELAGLVRQLFPDEAAQRERVDEEAPLLDADAWRARVPEAA